jgi:hypothetical protein
MGVMKLFSTDSYTSNVTNLPNPKPNNYKVLRYREMGGYLLIEIKYLDCTNYEGRKIMIYRCRYEELMSQVLIDPHFSENKKYRSPIVRLEPTEAGWDNGIKFINEIYQ